ncbi:MAG: hypothetical protein ACI9C1_003799 [Candidatus Aldehydirespiratoraceae bacterium]|jgi:uncharacterized protein (TIGR01777 family)
MRVLVSGSTGLVGSALVAGLTQAGHEPVRLVRKTIPDDLPTARWDPANGHFDDDGLDGIDAVIHLAGEGIAEKRWSPSQKARILDSRVAGTTLLAERIAAASTPPAVMISGSAIGFYGDQGDAAVDESSAAGTGFLADVVGAWESATAVVNDPPTRLVHLRTGIVLSSEGGALATQLPFFKMGIGGRIGDGKQWLSWISIADMVGAMIWLLDAPVRGPVNLCAPNPVTNAEFTKTLGRVLHRPTLLPIPKPALWARLGRELTQALLYTSQRVTPSVLTDHGYTFEHSDLEQALRAVLDRPKTG